MTEKTYNRTEVLFLFVLCAIWFYLGYMFSTYPVELPEEHYKVDFDCSSMNSMGWDAINITMKMCREGNCSEVERDMLTDNIWTDGWHMCVIDDFDGHYILANMDFDDEMRCEYVK